MATLHELGDIPDEVARPKKRELKKKTREQAIHDAALVAANVAVNGAVKGRPVSRQAIESAIWKRRPSLFQEVKKHSLFRHVAAAFML